MRNKEIQRARLWAKAEVEQRLQANDIHPEARDALNGFVGKIHPADEAQMLLTLDKLFDGSLTAEGWRAARKSFGLR